MIIEFYSDEYLKFIERNFPAREYLKKFTSFMLISARPETIWQGICPLCESPNFRLKTPDNKWHCDKCIGTNGEGSENFWSIIPLIMQLHNFEIDEAHDYLEGWIRVHTDLVIPEPKFESIDAPDIESAEQFVNLCNEKADDNILDAETIQ